MGWKDGLAQRGTWAVLLACALFAVACTRGGPHPEPPAPIQPAAGEDGGSDAADGGVRTPTDGSGPAGEAGAGGAGGVAGTGAAGADSAGDCPGDEDAGVVCDDDAGSLR